MKRILIPLFILTGISMSAQDRKPNRNVGGQFSLGVRSTASLFSDAGSSIGTGAGGQFRIRLYDFMNTEWFGDYITSSIGTLGSRTDYHVGWSVMFYVPKKKPFHKYIPKPYLLVGHCFDYTKVEGNNPFYQSTTSSAHRWSSAVQAGLGFHVPFSERVDLSFSGQYMIHLGNDLETQTLYSASHDPFLYVVKSESAGLDGHLLLTCSLNIRLADLWHDNKRLGGAAEPTPDQNGNNPNYIQQ